MGCLCLFDVALSKGLVLKFVCCTLWSHYATIALGGDADSGTASSAQKSVGILEISPDGDCTRSFGHNTAHGCNASLCGIILSTRHP